MQLTGIDLNSYKSQQMQRRLNTYLLRSGQQSWPDFFKAIRTSPADIAKLKDYLTINVTAFFRDKEKYDYLKNVVMPELLRTRPQLRIWSAGCSRGHEPYSIAIMLAELTGPYRRHTIVATDIDQSALAWAKTGGPYIKDEVTNVSPVALSKYFSLKDKGYFVNDNLRSRVSFGQYNLLSAPFLPPGETKGDFDLVICRNVVIYFTAEVKDKLYQQFYSVLRSGGILFVGGTEIVSKASDIGFETAGISFYRRNGTNAPANTAGRFATQPRISLRGRQA